MGVMMKRIFDWIGHLFAQFTGSKDNRDWLEDYGIDQDLLDHHNPEDPFTIELGVGD
jgi:hypothetical protein